MRYLLVFALLAGTAGLASSADQKQDAGMGATASGGVVSAGGGSAPSKKREVHVGLKRAQGDGTEVAAPAGAPAAGEAKPEPGADAGQNAEPAKKKFGLGGTTGFGKFSGGKPAKKEAKKAKPAKSAEEEAEEDDQ